jgi:hypothetical protein
MTPKEKAYYLVMIFKSSESEDGYNDVRDIHAAIRCALIAVDEIINHHSQEQGLYRIDQYYWQEVKTEIQKL